MYMLCSGEGTHDGQGGNPIIPRGTQRVEEGGESMGAYERGLKGSWELEEEPLSYAMFMRMSEAKGLEPCTVEDTKM